MLALFEGSCASRAVPAGPSAFDRTAIVDVRAFGAIPSLDRPEHEAADTIDPAPNEPVVVVEAGEAVRAYPLSILAWHAVANDVVGTTPVAVVYDPSSDTAAAYERRAGGRTIELADSGKVYRGVALLTDEDGSTLFLPTTGRAVAGALRGVALRPVASHVTSAAAYRAATPSATVLSPRTGFARPYGRTANAGFARRPAPPERTTRRRPDGRLPAMSRVAGLPGGLAYPYETVRAAGVVQEGGLVLVWQPGVADPLDADVVARSRDAGGVAAFVATVGGAGELTFATGSGGMRDRQTGSTWDRLGRATAGPLKGRRLAPVPTVRSMWFAWSATVPGARVYAPEPGG